MLLGTRLSTFIVERYFPLSLLILPQLLRLLIAEDGRGRSYLRSGLGELVLIVGVLSEYLAVEAR